MFLYVVDMRAQDHKNIKIGVLMCSFLLQLVTKTPGMGHLKNSNRFKKNLYNVWMGKLI